MSASIRLKAVATSRPNDFEIKAYVPITLLRITPESRTLDQLHAETRDVLSRRCIYDLGPVKIVKRFAVFCLSRLVKKRTFVL